MSGPVSICSYRRQVLAGRQRAGLCLSRRAASINSEQRNFSVQAADRYCDANVAMQNRRLCASLRFSFCNSCRKLHLSQLRPRHCDGSSFAHFPTYPIRNHLAGPKTRWHAHCKALGHNKSTAPSGASREKNEGRGCSAEGALHGTTAIGGRLVRRSSLVITGALHGHPKTLADIKRPVVRTAARWPVTHG